MGFGVLVLALVVGAAIAFWPANPPGDTPGEPATTAEVDVYLQPTCGCCHQYLDFLRAQGFAVTAHELEDLAPVKAQYAIPVDLQSCHTSVIRGYFVEGHVPAAALQELLEKRPPIDGIALPGMPPGAPGMGGTQQDPFIVYALVGGQSSVFLVL